MQDPIISTVFPEREDFEIIQQINSRTAPLTAGKYGTPTDFFNSVINFDTGEYNLAFVRCHYLAYPIPSAFARENLLYLQLLASGQTSSEHYTDRGGLPSYLLAETFCGTGHLSYEGKEYDLKPGDLFLIDCRRKHVYHAGPDGWGYRMIHFSGTQMPGIYKAFDKAGFYVFHFNEKHIIYEYTKDLYLERSMDSAGREINENRILQGLTGELLKQLPVYADTQAFDSVRRLRQYLREHCGEPLSLDDIAKTFHTSKYHMCRNFRKNTGETIFAFLTRCRIDLAGYLLVNSRKTVEEISQECGYNEVNSFYIAFRKYTGTSPSAYRRTHMI